MSIWQKVFSRRNWQNKPSTATPINATNLNAGDYAINVIDDRVIELRDMVNNLDGYQAQAAQAIELARRWAQWTDESTPTETNNSKYWAGVAKDAADMAVINLGEAGYLGFQINEYGHLIMTKSVMLDHLDFNLDSNHKDLIVSVTDTGWIDGNGTQY